MNPIIFIFILIIPAIAQMSVSISYGKYKQIKNTKNLTGFDVARKILDQNGLEEMYIVETKGNLTDHYDPNKKVVRLSTHVFHESSIAAMAIAAHECGHALQDKEGYLYLKVRSIIFPIVNFATSFSYFLIFLGILSESFNLIWTGILCVGTGLIFQLITLPVEINASKRAKTAIQKLNLAKEFEQNNIKKMLGCAASTYVAGVLSSALELLRLVLQFQNRDK